MELAKYCRKTKIRKKGVVTDFFIEISDDPLFELYRNQ